MMKGDRMAKRSSFGSIVRKRLSDITNSIPQPKTPTPNKKQPLQSDSTAKEYIDHLVKENMALAKLIADKNKIVELTGIELQKMRIHLQKMQMQNWNLAQSNSHIVAELNLGREKLKALQHEIVCKDALLKAKNLELEGKTKMNSQKDCCQVGSKEGEETMGNTKPCEGGHRRRPTRSQSMGPLTASQQFSEKETASKSKRRCVRRQSARFKSQQQEATENLFEIEDAKFLVGQPLDSPMHEENATPSTKKEEHDENCAPRFEAREPQRTSISRPLRKAVEKVQSYKEIPLNIKMRRSG